jgi:hypothetical protein
MLAGRETVSNKACGARFGMARNGSAGDCEPKPAEVAA